VAFGQLIEESVEALDGTTTTTLSRFSKRVGWGIADQTLSSLTNFALGIIVARSASAKEFGAYGLAFAAYTIILGICRAASTGPLLMRYSALDGAAWRVAARAATGTATALGLVFGVGGILVSQLLRPPASEALLAIAVTTPGLVLQDAWRACFFSAGRGKDAFLNDLVWAAVMFGGVPVLIVTGSGTLFSWILLWGVAAGAGALVGIGQSRLIPRPMWVLRWWREQKDLAPRLVGMFGARNGASQVVMYSIAGFAGLAGVGAIRAGMLVLGPLNVIFLGVNQVSLPEGVRLARTSLVRLQRVLLLIGASLAAAALTWGSVAMLLPDRVGGAIVGSSWFSAKHVLLPLTIMLAAAGMQLAAVVGVLSLTAGKRALRTHLVEGTLTALGGTLGALFGGTVGAAVGLAAAYVLEAAIWWLQFQLTLREAAVTRHAGSAVGQPDHSAEASRARGRDG
jgi:hypothetical protein